MSNINTTPTAQGVLWVCVDCLLAREGTYNPKEAAGLEEPWNLEQYIDVSYGLDFSQHDCEAPGEVWCDCERKAFSSSSCGACGSDLAGERHAYTWWA